MHVRAILTCGFFFFCLGCGPKLLDQREVSMEVGDISSIEIGPFKQEQTVKVVVSSTDAPISIYLHPKDQTEHVDYAISYQKEPQGIFAGVESTEAETLEAAVPAESEAVVRLQNIGKQSTKVQLTISN